MAAPVKDGKVWRHRVQVGLKRVSGTFETKAAALAWEAGLRTAKPGGSATTQTCKDAFDKYALEVSKTKKGHRWEALRLTAFGKSALGAVRVREVNASHVAAWRDWRMTKRPRCVSIECNGKVRHLSHGATFTLRPKMSTY